MNRRDLIKGAAAVPLATALPVPDAAAQSPAPVEIAANFLKLMAVMNPDTSWSWASRTAWEETCRAAVRPGTDFARVWSAFPYWVLRDPEFGALQPEPAPRDRAKGIATIYGGMDAFFDSSPAHDAIMTVSTAHMLALDGAEILPDGWLKAKAIANRAGCEIAAVAASGEAVPAILWRGYSDYGFRIGHDADWNWSKAREQDARSRYVDAARDRLFGLLRRA